MDRLFLVFRQTLAGRVQRLGIGKGDRGGELGSDVGALAQRRDRSGINVLGERFVLDVGDVENFEAFGTVGGV